jgi:cytochrome c biogenesis protein CcmG/thiol:disulfide interchange protein DsbE
VRLGPGQAPRLLLFFATWDSEVTDLARQLEALNAYATSPELPALTAVDEGSVEPGPGALPRLLASLGGPLSYPVAIDRTGRVADGYGVQDEPWLVLVSGSGRILWYYDVATSGWPSRAALARDIHAALARAPGAAPSAAAAQRALAGSPAPLAALHRQAGRLLGAQPALLARLRALRGYPVVVNAWASWCTPCRAEFGLLAYAAAHYGRQVAFLGADTRDSAGDARAFLTAHAVSYPSYQTTIPGLGALAQVQGLPTTIFIDRVGKVAYVHTGQYVAQGTIDQDIQSHALG